MAGDAGDIHDHTAVAALDHVLGGLPPAQKDARQIHPDYRVPLIEAHRADHGAILDLDQKSIAHDSRVVDQAVQPAKIGCDTVHRIGDLRLFRDVHAIVPRRDRVRRAKPRSLLQIGCIEVEQREVRALLRQLHGGYPADAPARTGDHHGSIA